MASRITKLDVWNMALGMARGRGEVSDLAQNSPEAAACRLYYETVTRRVQEAAHWPVCRSFVAPALIATAPDDGTFTSLTPPEGWLYSFAFPENGLIPWELRSGVPFAFGVQEREDPMPEVLAIFTNDEEPGLVYARYQERTELWSGHMVEVTTLALAAELAAKLSGDKARVRDLKRSAVMALNEARASTSTTQTDRTFLAGFHAARGYTDVNFTPRFVYEVSNLYASPSVNALSDVGAAAAQSGRRVG